MICATVIVKFPDKIKKYHKGCPNKQAAELSIKKMQNAVKEYLIDIIMLGVIWDGKNRPWRDENEILRNL